MTAAMREPECVLLKRRGAEHVKKLIAGMSLEEQLAFWQQRTEAMLERQKEARQKQADYNLRIATENTEQVQDMRSEYHFDYVQAKTNRFVEQKKAPVTVTLDADVAQVFATSEAVNKALRAILTALPNSQLHG